MNLLLLLALLCLLLEGEEPVLGRVESPGRWSLLDRFLQSVYRGLFLTTKQVHAILWRYIGQAHRKGNLPGRITLDDEWYMGPGGKELVAFGRKPADHDQSAFQGIHALNPLILVDEACGVPKSIFDAIDALATNSNARVLAIGNPDDPSSHFAQICKPGSGWHLITVSVFDTPAYTGE